MRPAPDDRSPADLRSFGVINLDKPPGPSAHEVTAWVRDMVGVNRAAHAGTLDPKVTGCLPVVLGDATRLAQVFLEGYKEYIAVLELHAPAPRDFESILTTFEGPIYQRPPRKSAVRRTRRVREIYELEALELADRQALIRIQCESGTYIRKLCHDLGLALGTGAHMGDLRRTATTPFDDRDLVTLEELADALAYATVERDDPPIAIEDVIDPAERVLEDLPSLQIAESAAAQVANGAPVYAPGVFEWDDTVTELIKEGRESGNLKEQPLVACYGPTGAAVCIGRLVGDPDSQEGEVVTLERVLL